MASASRKIKKKSTAHKTTKGKGQGAPEKAGAGRKRTPRSRKPEAMSLDEWQIALRREFGAEQDFEIENTGGEAVFSEFRVTNPESGGAYRVAIRGEAPGVNYCSCPDYATNQLGSCKHIEFTLSKLRRKRGGKKALARGYEAPFSDIYLRYGLKREVVFGAATDCPKGLRELAKGYFDEEGLLKPEAYARFDDFLRDATRIARGADHELRLYDDTIEFIAHVRDDAHRRAVIDKAFRDGADSAAFKKLLQVSLYPYQCRGALFAARAGRCLLADDMGLGKTIQAIAAAEILARHAGVERALVICPTSLKHQWQAEIAKFTDRSAQVVEGPLAARQAAYRADSFFKITNYDVVHRDLDDIAGWAPDLIVLDEAQRIKNWKTRTAQSVKRLESEHAIVLTGTPLENRLEELHSIVEFVDRHRLGPTFRFLAEHQHTDEFGKVVGYRNLSTIARTLEPILLRRTKKEVLRELPERLDKTFLVPMTEQQMKHHEENQEIVGRIVNKWRRHGFLTEKDQRRLMIALQRMRMACNSTFLLDQETDHGHKSDELATRLDEIFESNGAKVVVFSQWLRTHELLARRFAARGWDHVLFHGGVPGPKRKDLVRRFKEDADCRIFLSTDAGGVGLNLQFASVVVNMDQPWNPAVLEQRIGRVHRLGQRRPVSVINYVAQGTIEHSMLSVLDFKKSMFTGVLDGGSDEVFLGGSRLKRFMETVERATDSVPAPMPAEDEATGAGDAAEADSCTATVPTGAERDAEPDSDAKAESKPPTPADKTTHEEEPQTPRAPASQVGAATPGPSTPGGATPGAPSSSSLPGAVPDPTAAWTDLTTAGLAFLEKLGQALQAHVPLPGAAPAPGAKADADAQPESAENDGPKPKPAPNVTLPASFMSHDERTGQPCLKLPMPQPEVLQTLADILGQLADARR